MPAVGLFSDSLRGRSLTRVASSGDEYGADEYGADEYGIDEKHRCGPASSWRRSAAVVTGNAAYLEIFGREEQ